MSLAFAPASVRQNAVDQQSTVQKLLDENSHLISRIKECQTAGRPDDGILQQKLLHRNLIMLAKAADQNLVAYLREDGNGRPSPVPEHGSPDVGQPLPNAGIPPQHGTSHQPAPMPPAPAQLAGGPPSQYPFHAQQGVPAYGSHSYDQQQQQMQQQMAYQQGSRGYMPPRQ